MTFAPDPDAGWQHPAGPSAVEVVYRDQSRRVLATLIRLLGDFDRAEEALAEAFAAAAAQWPSEGIPRNPFAWLVSAGRFKAIDRIRSSVRQEALADQMAHLSEPWIDGPDAMDDEAIADDQLRLIFTCCHPSLVSEAQVALTLREVAGLTTDEVAAAFRVPVTTMAQRIVRAKARIRDERIPYRTPDRDELPDRLEEVLGVLYLIFNEGYLASGGGEVARANLTAEAIRLARHLVALLPDPEAQGLLALMLLQESRRAARAGADGALILFEDQDRSRWDRALISEGIVLVERIVAGKVMGAYAIQAAIAAEHAAAVDSDVDWHRVVGLYDLLLVAQPSPVAELNRAAAIAMRDGAAAGLALIDDLLARTDLAAYQPAHVARAELMRRSGRFDEARAVYATALALKGSEPVRRFIRKRLAELG